MLTNRRTEKHDEANRDKSETFLPSYYPTAAARHHRPYSDDAVNQGFESQHVQETSSAAEGPDFLGAHTASNPMGNAFLSPR